MPYMAIHTLPMLASWLGTSPRACSQAVRQATSRPISPSAWRPASVFRTFASSQGRRPPRSSRAQPTRSATVRRAPLMAAMLERS